MSHCSSSLCSQYSLESIIGNQAAYVERYPQKSPRTIMATTILIKIGVLEASSWGPLWRHERKLTQILVVLLLLLLLLCRLDSRAFSLPTSDSRHRSTRSNPPASLSSVQTRPLPVSTTYLYFAPLSITTNNSVTMGIRPMEWDTWIEVRIVFFSSPPEETNRSGAAARP